MPHFDWAVGTDGLIGAAIGGLAIGGTAWATIRSAGHAATEDRRIRADEAQRDRQSAADVAQADRLHAAELAREDRQHAEQLADLSRLADAAREVIGTALDVMDGIYTPDLYSLDKSRELKRRTQRLIAISSLFEARVGGEYPQFTQTLTDITDAIERTRDQADHLTMDNLLRIYCAHVTWWVSRPQEVLQAGATANELRELNDGFPAVVALNGLRKRLGTTPNP